MTKVNFMELAKYRQAFQMKICSEDNRPGVKQFYRNTIFIAISEDNKMSVSLTPHVLDGAHKCLIIHKLDVHRNGYTGINVHTVYEFEFINEFGEVTDGNIDDEYRFSQTQNCIVLYKRNKKTFSSEEHCGYITIFTLRDNIRAIKFLWELYLNLKNVTDDEERKKIKESFKAEMERLT